MRNKVKNFLVVFSIILFVEFIILRCLYGLFNVPYTLKYNLLNLIQFIIIGFLTFKGYGKKIYKSVENLDNE